MGGLTPEQACSLYESTNHYLTAQARATSNYSACIDGALVRLLDWKQPTAHAAFAHKMFRTFVSGQQFSCVAAKAAVATGAYRFAYYARMAQAATTAGLARDICAFLAEAPCIESPYTTFIATFGESIDDESHFERLLWAQLQQLHDIDTAMWDRTVSSDVDDPNFAFSFGGTAFFVVGMHPRASRYSRRLPFPALVFNAHDQFRQARQSGRFTKIQRLVRERELALQGSINPELHLFGEVSEARQYAGRKNEEQWHCPFHPRS